MCVGDEQCQIREMQKKLQEKPIISKNKVYIINNADKMTTEAQNSLLKTLEEPPEFVTIILIGSNENMFLTTIQCKNIVDIKFSVSNSIFGNEQIYCFSCMIIYEE